MAKATLANMKKWYGSQEGVVALSRVTGEIYSANPADYWYMGDDEVLRGSEGDEMILAKQISQWHEVGPLT